MASEIVNDTLCEGRLFLEALLPLPALRELHRREEKGADRASYPKLETLPEDVARVVAAYGGQCAFCAGRAVNAAGEPGIDWLVPESRGGTAEAANLVAACETCRTARRGKHLDAFLAKRIDLDARAVYERMRLACAALRAAMIERRGGV